MASDAKQAIPTLTQVVESTDEPVATPNWARPEERENLIAELQTQLAASTFELAERLVHAAATEMEVALFEQVAGRLRQELPDMIDSVLRSHLDDEENDT